MCPLSSSFCSSSSYISCRALANSRIFLLDFGLSSLLFCFCAEILGLVAELTLQWLTPPVFLVVELLGLFFFGICGWFGHPIQLVFLGELFLSGILVVRFLSLLLVFLLLFPGIGILLPAQGSWSLWWRVCSSIVVGVGPCTCCRR